MSEKTKELFTGELKVICVGLDHFAESLRKQDVQVKHVDWRPMAGGDERLAAMLRKMGMK
ncbi:MAG: hypothetical protein ACOCVT_00075 [bacterium]